MDTIEGRVVGARPGQRIVLYARAGSQWWIQPFRQNSLTEIGPDSHWSNATHLGTQYAALLVEPDYHPDETTPTLPQPGAGVIALATVIGPPGPPPISKTISFSGYEWKIRTLGSDRGARVNEYDPANVWTDRSGALHMSVRKHGDKWMCSEISLTRSLGYGSYRAVLADTSQLPPSVAAEMYIWDELGTDPNHREMNIQISQWGNPQDKNAQFVVQPFYVPTNVVRFTVPRGAVSCSFRWEPGKVDFRTVQVAGGVPPHEIAKHEFTSGIPVPGSESVHLCLYVYGTNPDPIPDLVEVVVDKFEYLP